MVNIKFNLAEEKKLSRAGGEAAYPVGAAAYTGGAAAYVGGAAAYAGVAAAYAVAKNDYACTAKIVLFSSIFNSMDWTN